MRTDQDKNHPRKAGMPVAASMICCFAFCLTIALADGPVKNTIKGFRTPLEYFDAPHEYQMKSFLEGTEAELGQDGLIFIRNAKLQTYHEDGTLDMTITAPECTFDSKQQTVSSAGALQLQSADDKLLHEGKGFFWRQTNSELIVSNFVRTTVRGPLTNTFSP